MQAPYPVTPPGQPAPPRPKSWFERNWKWFVPLGCLGILVALGLFFGAIFGVVMASMRSNDVYREAMARASSDSRVLAELGSPIRAGFMISGSIRVSGPSGTANLAIPLSGPRAEGKLYAVAEKSAGTWTFSTLEVEIDGRPNRVSLLPPATGP